jgi:LAO/AO transport system kinase
MNRHATDDGVFIRSLATRGHQGGLSRATSASVAVLDAAGFPVIFVETVGAGQAELDVADAADGVVVVTAPGLGDEVQALKAGLLEIADLLVVNKGDRDGADRTLADLGAMLALGARAVPTLLKTVAAAEATPASGVGELVVALELLRSRPVDERTARRRRQAARQIVAIAGERARARAEAALAGNDGGGGAGAVFRLGPTVDAVAARTLDPWSAADALLEVLKYPA